MGRMVRTVIWQSLDGPGSEWCALGREGEGWAIEGTIVVAFGERPAKVEYAVRCDDGWQTRHVEIAISDGTGQRTLRLDVDGEGRWWRDEEEIATWRGLHDIDLSVTPATNTVPIRRLGIGIGEAREVTAAWVRFPELSLERLPQRYERVDEHRYRYESDGGAFEAELMTDELGLIVRYEGLWERVAAAG